jgi:hypothetical protein
MSRKNVSPGVVYEKINELQKIYDKEEEHNENDIEEFLKDPDNIIVAFGQTLTGYSRNEISALSEKKVNKYKDDKDNKFIQVVGRHLIREQDLDLILNPEFCIFDICTLIDVVLVTNAETGARQKRSYYKVKAYTLMEYMKL